MKASKGNFIAFQDADDISLKNRIDKQFIPIFQNPSLFSVSRIIRNRCVSEKLNISNQNEMMDLVNNRRKTDKSGDYEFQDQAVFGLESIVYSRKVFEKFGLFEEHRFAEDLELLEHILFLKPNEKIHPKFNGHPLLKNGKEISDIFQKINEVLVVCPKKSAKI